MICRWAYHHGGGEARKRPAEVGRCRGVRPLSSNTLTLTDFQGRRNTYSKPTTTKHMQSDAAESPEVGIRQVWDLPCIQPSMSDARLLQTRATTSLAPTRR